jgi:hypothetical protein
VTWLFSGNTFGISSSVSLVVVTLNVWQGALSASQRINTSVGDRFMNGIVMGRHEVTHSKQTISSQQLHILALFTDYARASFGYWCAIGKPFNIEGYFYNSSTFVYKRPCKC